MKRVLVTGFTSIGAKDREPAKRKIATTVYAVVDTLRKGGVSVDQRPVAPGEDLSSYDRIIVVPATLGGFASGYLMGGAWAVAEFASKVTLLLDDWQCAKIVPSLEGFLKHAEKNWLKHQLFADLDKWRKYRQQVELGITGIMHLPLPLMAPTFYGRGDLGDLRFGRTDRPHLLFDPSIAFAGMYDGIYAGHKEPLWISTSLTDRTRWHSRQYDGTAWPVRAFGCKARGQERLTERDLVRHEYGRAWGVLSPPTGLGSGLWWRARYQHAIEARCILAGDPEETVFCGPAYGYSPAQIEGMAVDELKWVRYEQSRSYLLNRWPANKLTTALSNFLFTRTNQ